MNTENAFLIKYGLHPFVTHATDDGRSVFTICAREGRKMVRHAQSLIAGNYGDHTAVRVV